MNSWQKIALILALVGLASAAEGVADKLQFHYSSSVFSNWEGGFWSNPRTESWKRKYAMDAEGELIRPLRPAFPLSTTALVMFTDAWHCAKAVRQTATRIALLLLAGWAGLLTKNWHYVLGYIALWAVQAGGFHTTYTLIHHL